MGSDTFRYLAIERILRGEKDDEAMGEGGGEDGGDEGSGGKEREGKEGIP